MFGLFDKAKPEDGGLERLHATLRLRETPETVANIIAKTLDPRDLKTVQKPLKAVIAGSVKRWFGWSSMSNRFREPVGAVRQLAKARELGQLFLGSALPVGDDLDALDKVISALDTLIGKPLGANSFKTDRLTRERRVAVGLRISRRRYDKLFRLAVRLEEKARRIRSEEEKFEFVLFSKAALGPRLTIQDFNGDLPTAAFVAYYSARMKLRSEFTNQGQQKPFDEVSAALLKLCEKRQGTQWYAIAHVFPRADVLTRLSDEKRGILLGQCFEVLRRLADRLGELQRITAINLESMIVQRGNDSSTWNMLAGAWNKARDHWIALVEAMGADELFDTILPGKVMRLMAADVAAWHRISGGAIHPDTPVWHELPWPWLVLKGEADCTRALIEEACGRAEVDPVKSGWTAARSRRTVAAFKPTPELVHGVTVSNPYLADYLRRRGAFSGKWIKPASALT